MENNENSDNIDQVQIESNVSLKRKKIAQRNITSK